ncbi:MAG: ATP-binding protein [Sulfuricaulis sp.]|nr:ATP-binding protein [Sulfuricaulis sp.]
MAKDPYSIEELLRLVKSSGENSNVDAKAPMGWDEGDESARLAKDIAAFANSRDGGAIVIGKSENNGQFEYVGVSAEQAATFDTTRVANWINSRFNPPINLTCHTVESDSKLYVVIVVSEFGDIPALCVRTVGPTSGKGKPLLSERTLYVRTANAESAPLGSADELRELIGIATRKRADEMLTMFHAMMQGKRLVAPPDNGELFAMHFETVKTSVETPIADRMASGAWSMSFHPSSFRADRFPETEQLENIINKHAVRLRDEFPANRRGTTPFNWGIGNSYYSESWGFSRAGLFHWCETFDENRYSFKSPWHRVGGEPDPEIPQGQWINYQPHLFKIIEFFTFMARMISIFDSAESLSYRLTAGPLSGRRLVSTNPEISLDAEFAEPAGENVFIWKRTTPIQEFQATWKDDCAAATKRFFELFPGHRITAETFRKWVDRFQTRDFGR